MSSQLPRQQYGLWAIGGIIGLCFVYIGASRMRPVAPMTLQGLSSSTQSGAPAGDVKTLGEPKTSEAPEVSEIVVHVAGAVKRPGVVHAKPGARVDDAVRMAGGAKPNADLDQINLAAKLIDGSQLYIPSRGSKVVAEARSGPRPSPLRGSLPQPSLPRSVAPFDPGPVSVTYEGGPKKENPYAPNANPAQEAPAVRTEPPPVVASVGTASTGNASPGPSSMGVVDLNTATSEELDTLPGVGPATAQKILDYRQTHGRFSSVEQLLEVSGIGPKKLEKMRGRVKI